MARHGPYFLPGQTLHAIQRGNDCKPIFFSDHDRLLYPNWLSAAMARHGALLHAYVLMTNHVHLLLTTERALTLPRILQSLGRRYVAHVNAGARAHFGKAAIARRFPAAKNSEQRSKPPPAVAPDRRGAGGCRRTDARKNTSPKLL